MDPFTTSPPFPCSLSSSLGLLEVGHWTSLVLSSTLFCPAQVHYRRYRLFHKVGRGRGSYGGISTHGRRFIFRNIICRFGIPECLVADRGAAFMAAEVNNLMTDFGIQFLHSTPYYAQSNGQAEASNKVIITILKKMLADNARDWHNELDSTLWAYRTSKRSPTGTTPYALMFGHDAVLPLEINVRSLRVQEQHQLLGEDYVQAMWQEHEDLSESRLAALDSLVLEKKRIARIYDKRTRGLSFGEGDLVWKTVLPLGDKVRGRGPELEKSNWGCFSEKESVHGNLHNRRSPALYMDKHNPKPKPKGQARGV
ncbi:hypothetical protein M0R45_038190 [Rubus argutus]|uniref:Integrase catalytic domain-containing protein n=1 Tax=Rubus argutus TaxID=59490 RepID=A0AAW1W1M0_RUBAR